MIKEMWKEDHNVIIIWNIICFFIYLKLINKKKKNKVKSHGQPKSSEREYNS